MAGLTGVPRSIPRWDEQARSYLQGATGSYGSMMQQQKSTETSHAPDPSKTVGGGLTSAASMGMAGAYLGAEGMLGSAIGGPAGLAIGAGVGLAAYLFS